MTRRVRDNRHHNKLIWHHQWRAEWDNDTLCCNPGGQLYHYPSRSAFGTTAAVRAIVLFFWKLACRKSYIYLHRQFYYCGLWRRTKYLAPMGRLHRIQPHSSRRASIYNLVCFVFVVFAPGCNHKIVFISGFNFHDDAGDKP